MICIKIGAPRSVIGLNVLQKLLRKKRSQLSPSQSSFRFGDDTRKSLEITTLSLETPPGIPDIVIKRDLVDADLPLLLGLDVMDERCLVADTVSNQLIKKPVVQDDTNKSSQTIDDWKIPLVRANQHIYAQMKFPYSVLYTRAQLGTTHRNIFHPFPERQCILIRKAKPDETMPETLDILKDISARCDPCQRILVGPKQFRVSFQCENLAFNKRMFPDVIYIDGSPVLHIIDEATRFSAALFESGVSTKQI